jgi:hypothetical protein
MFELRVILPASPIMIRAWLTGLVDRVIPLEPDPAGWGQAQMSPQGFLTDSTLRRQPIPPEIEAAGGLGVGLEMAAHGRNGLLQPMGPVVVFLIVPMGQERSEVRIYFPLGITRESHTRLVEEFRSSWPGEIIQGDERPWWAGRDFDRRALFQAIATGGPPPSGAPAQRRLEDPLPWRDKPTQELRPGGDPIGEAIRLAPQDAEMVRLWTDEGKKHREIGTILSLSEKRVRNRLSELRSMLGEDRVPSRARPRRAGGT